MSQSPALLRVLSAHADAPPSPEHPHTEALLTRQLSRMLAVKQRAAKVQLNKCVFVCSALALPRHGSAV